MKILKITDAWDWIAEADNLLRMARELRRRGHEVTIACARGTGLESRARADGFEPRVLPGLERRKSPLAFVRAAVACRRLVAEVRPEVVHAYRSPPHLMALWAIRGRPGIRLVRTRATMVPPRPTRLNRRLHRATDRTLVSAEAVRKLCVEAGFDAERITVVRGGLELERFVPEAHDGAASRRALGIPAGALVAGHLARLAPVKGHVHLLDAFREVAARVPASHLALVGPALPGMDARVRGWIAERGLAGRVTVAGEVADVAAAIAAFDVGVVASVGSEAFSRAALEYLAMGLPVVATAVGSLPELVEEGRTGRLVPPEDPRAMADALIALLQDAPLRRSLGAAAAEAARAFGAEAQAARLEAIYEELLRPRSARPARGDAPRARP